MASNSGGVVEGVNGVNGGRGGAVWWAWWTLANAQSGQLLKESTKATSAVCFFARIAVAL